MKQTKTMVLGILFILVGISLLFSCSGSLSTVNAIVAGWAGTVPVHGSDEYNTLVTNTLQTGTWIAFLLIVGGLLVGVIAYFRKNS
jgi:hypothetical protein